MPPSMLITAVGGTTLAVNWRVTLGPPSLTPNRATDRLADRRARDVPPAGSAAKPHRAEPSSLHTGKLAAVHGSVEATCTANPGRLTETVKLRRRWELWGILREACRRRPWAREAAAEAEAEAGVEAEAEAGVVAEEAAAAVAAAAARPLR